MIIKQIMISAFGGTKDLTIDLSRGMNIIYGKNEAGKSTTQAFIKAMFYGFTSNRQSIRDNDRKRYRPWDIDRMNGQLIIEDEKNIEYLIKRSFAQTKKNDTSVVLNAISGIVAKNINFSEPGTDIFGLGCEAFEKTLFIKQLGCKVSRDNEDEIMTKLSNISQSGDEEISFHKSKEALLQALKDIANVRKNGKLDVQKRKLSDLTEERSEVLKIKDEIINDQIELNQYLKELNMIKTEIKNLDQTKRTSQKMKLYKEYTELINCIEIVDKSTKEISNLEQELNIDGKVINQQYIDNLKEKYGEYLNDKRLHTEMDDQVKDTIESLQKLRNQKDHYKGFESVDEDIEPKLLNYQNEIKTAEKSEIELHDLKDELEQSEVTLTKEKEILGALISFEGVSEETEQIITLKEEKIRDLEQKLENNLKKDNIKLRFEILKDKKTTATIMTGIGLLLTLIAIILGFTMGPALFAIFIISIPCLIYGIYSLSDITRRLMVASQEMSELKDIEGIQKEITLLKEELENIYKDYNVSSYKEYNAKLKKYYESKTGLDVINALIKEKKVKILVIEQSINSEDKNHKINFVNATFSLCNCKGLEDFTSKLKIYEKLAVDINNLKVSIENSNTRMTEVKRKQCEAEKTILKSLKRESLGPLTIDNVTENIGRLTTSLVELKESENTIKSTNSLYNSLLQGRNIVEIEKQLIGFVPNDKQEDILTVEEIDIMFKDKNVKLMDCEKTINNIENLIKTKLIGRRVVDQIEVELENTNEKIGYYEHALKSIEQALTFLEDSFEEIRKNFGPKLNAKVGEVLSKITLGKYQNIKIADNYDVKIEDNNLNMIKELDYFSNGTLDQIYFALRLGIIDLIYGEQHTMPIILDDTFVQYDDERLKAALDYLHSISQNKQIILFACQKRELEMLKDYSDIGVITI